MHQLNLDKIRADYKKGILGSVRLENERESNVLTTYEISNIVGSYNIDSSGKTYSVNKKE